MFKKHPIDMKLPISITKPWTTTFKISQNTHMEVPLFQEKAFDAWMMFVLPEVKRDLN